nr:MAG TPA: hypothetical protein [Caudoviricetes sp.]
MVHRANTLARLLESFIGENPICTPFRYQHSHNT